MKTRYKATGELKLFWAVWNTSNKRSLISGLNLAQYEGSDKFINMFAHILSKNKFPHFRLYFRNVALLHPLEHAIYDHGTIEKQIEYSQKVINTKWDILATLKSELMEEYQLAFPSVSPEGIIMKYSDEEVQDKIRSLNIEHVDTLEAEGLMLREAELLRQVLSGI